MPLGRSAAGLTILALLAGSAGQAVAQSTDAAVERPAAPSEPTVNLRLTLTTFIYRESGDPGAPLATDGARPDGASPVRRFFNDLRLRARTDNLGHPGRGFALDLRARQTASGEFQAGAGAGSEYEVREAAVHDRVGHLDVSLGRQTVLEVAGTKIDGLALRQPLGKTWSFIAFGGAYPLRGSRSVDTDYPVLHPMDPTTGQPSDTGGTRLIPVATGAALSYHRPDLYGDVGVGGIVPLNTGDATMPADRRGRGFVSSTGYWRPGAGFNLYHYAVYDALGPSAGALTNLSAGANAYPSQDLQLTLAVNHVETELLQIAARDLLEDPDPAAMGLVQNRVELLRTTADEVRAVTSLAMARHRFEISLSGSLRRRPAIDVGLVGGGQVTFPASELAETSLRLVDRRSLAGLRLAGTASWFHPLDTDPGGASSGVVVRLDASRGFADERGQIDVDVSAQRFRDLGQKSTCDSLDPLACFGTERLSGAEAGALLSYQAAGNWLIEGDLHLGAQKLRSINPTGALVEWPAVLSVTGFGRLEWRFR